MDPLHQLLEDHGPNGWTFEGGIGTHSSGYVVQGGFRTSCYLMASAPNHPPFYPLVDLRIPHLSTQDALLMVQQRLNLTKTTKIQRALTRRLLEAHFYGTWNITSNVDGSWTAHALAIEGPSGQPFTSFQGPALATLIGIDLYQDLCQDPDLLWPDTRVKVLQPLFEGSFSITLPASAHTRLALRMSLDA